MSKHRRIIAFALLVLAAGPARTGTVFTTLGTGAGPTLQARRAQPANLLQAGDETILIDCGDGATSQLGKAGVPLVQVRTLFISHLHFDHIGGLFGLLSRRFQLLTPGTLTIYGPAGTKAVVDGMIGAMTPALAAWSGMRSQAGGGPGAGIGVVELHDGWTGRIGQVRVTAASNTHYATMAAGPAKGETYALRFDAPDRSIVYTGDTGPSPAVERLAENADDMVAEVMDAERMIADMRRSRPDVPAAVLAAVAAHHRQEHLSPEQAGLMAAHAKVKRLILTHDALPDSALDDARRAIARDFSGPVTFADDLQRF